MTDRDEPHHPQPDSFQEPRKSFGAPFVWENLDENTRRELIELQNAERAHGEREAIGDRARATIQRQEGEAARRHELEEWERERGIRSR